MVTRREFLSGLAATAAAALPVSGRTVTISPFHPAGSLGGAPRLSMPIPALRWRGESALSMGIRQGTMGAREVSRTPGATRTGDVAVPRVDVTALGVELRQTYSDLPRHFVFEYYPWYGANPWRHWNAGNRTPPAEIASTSMPRLGPYDSRDPAVLEQHARWIAEAGAGAINISWWGPGSVEDQAVPRIMDVMRDHGIRVAFHIEPFRNDRVATYVDDLLYLLREYGDKRSWDAFLLLRDASGKVGPVFKSFRTIVPEKVQDCHGRTFLVPDYVPDSTWRRQTDRLRTAVRQQFDRITLLADVWDMDRMQSAGFDGMALYDNFLDPRRSAVLAEAASSRDLVFSFNTNPGFDAPPAPPPANPDDCYSPPPGGTAEYDWTREPDRERFAERSRNRISETFRTTLALQTRTTLANARKGFLLVYLNSFNEWHEGHQFEPMKDAADLTSEERAFDYHNPREGDYRLRHLQELMRPVVAG
jgi:hypothetical protein